MAAQPTLGYGQRGEVSIDAYNQWQRTQPWYQQLIRSFGQDPNDVHLSDSQKQQVIKAAQANGVVVDEGGDGQEVDDSGNFRAKGHKLRNTLIVAGIAGAALLTAGAAGAFAGSAAAGGSAAGAGGVEAGVTAGLGSAALPGAGTAIGAAGAASGATGAAAAGAGAFDAAGNFIGPSTVSSVGGGTAAAGAGMSYADLLKYGLPVAGNLVGGLIQAKATSGASDAQQKYLEEALAYEKESDAYKRQIDANAVTKEASRYADYSGRIAPFVANGTSSNDRMAALLGLPARSGSSGYAGATGGGNSYNSGPPASQRVAIDPATQAAIRNELKATNSSDNASSWDEYVSSHGDSSTKNWDYWKNRIDTGDGVGKGYSGGPVAPTAPPTSPTAPSVTTQPQQRSASVQMRAPDGSVQTVNASDVPHYQQLGATVLQGAA